MDPHTLNVSRVISHDVTKGIKLRDQARCAAPLIGPLVLDAGATTMAMVCQGLTLEADLPDLADAAALTFAVDDDGISRFLVDAATKARRLVGCARLPALFSLLSNPTREHPGPQPMTWPARTVVMRGCRQSQSMTVAPLYVRTAHPIGDR
jgi:hypothetical protein